MAFGSICNGSVRSIGSKRTSNPSSFRRAVKICAARSVLPEPENQYKSSRFDAAFIVTLSISPLSFFYYRPILQSIGHSLPVYLRKTGASRPHNTQNQTIPYKQRQKNSNLSDPCQNGNQRRSTMIPSKEVLRKESSSRECRAGQYSQANSLYQQNVFV